MYKNNFLKGKKIMSANNNHLSDIFNRYIEQIEIIKKEDNKTDNIFKILHQETYENKHSIFLSWLFNPLASHGLGNTFAQAFFDKVAEENKKENRIEASKIKNILLEKRINGKKQIEAEKDKKRIDILIEGEDFVYVIENKYGSNVHDGQCKDYRDYVENEDKYKNCKNKEFVFLDIRKPKDFDAKHETNYANYDFISYREIIEILRNYLNKIKDPQNIFLKQYFDILNELYESTEDNSEINEICDKIPLNDILQICAIDGKDYENLEFDERRFVDVVKIYYQKKKESIDNTIIKCLKKITQDEDFFKDDYGQKKEMYGHTIPVSFEFIDKANYLFKKGEFKEDSYNNYVELCKNKKSLSKEQKKKKKQDSKSIEKKINSMKPAKKDNGNEKIPFQTIDFVAPHLECNNMSIDIYAGLVPRYSKYLCENFTSEQAKQLFLLTLKGWKVKVSFYIRNGSGLNYVKLGKNEKAEKVLNITKAEELLEILEIGKCFYDSGKIQKTPSELMEIKKNLSLLNSYLNKPDNSIEDFIDECIKTKNKKFLLGFAIVMTYEIEEKDWSEEKLEKIFYKKTLEGTKVFNYDKWFKEIIFKPEKEWIKN